MWIDQARQLHTLCGRASCPCPASPMVPSPIIARIAGTARVNTGLWFYSFGRYKCDSCNNTVRLTYDDKIKLLNGAPQSEVGTKTRSPASAMASRA